MSVKVLKQTWRGSQPGAYQDHKYQWEVETELDYQALQKWAKKFVKDKLDGEACKNLEVHKVAEHGLTYEGKLWVITAWTEFWD